MQLAAYLLCVISIYNILVMLRNRKLMYVILSLCSFGAGYAVWQRFNIPKSIVDAIITAMWVVSILIIYRGIVYKRTKITADSIKYCADELPCGICYWKNGGRIILANKRMNRICEEFTGERLLNGDRLYESINDGLFRAGGKTMSPRHTTVKLGNEDINELIVSDVTELYETVSALKRENEKTAAMNRKLYAYNLEIDEIIRKEEILKAKINIHDEMNRLIVSTSYAAAVAESDIISTAESGIRSAAESGTRIDAAAGAVSAEALEGEGTMNDIFGQWEKNALLLCKEATESERDDRIEETEGLAKALGISLELNRGDIDVVQSEHRELFFKALCEALVNAVKNGNATRMNVCIERNEGRVICRMSNDGQLPREDVVFTGGLRNLSVMARKQGADISVDLSDGFSLVLNLPEGE